MDLQNWKTTAAGILSALGAALMLAPLPEKYRWIPAFLSALAAGLIGVTAKDYNVHSTEKEVIAATVQKETAKQEAIATIKKDQ